MNTRNALFLSLPTPRMIVDTCQENDEHRKMAEIFLLLVFIACVVVNIMINTTQTMHIEDINEDIHTRMCVCMSKTKEYNKQKSIF